MVVLGLLLHVLASKAMKVRKDISAVARKVLHNADDKFVELMEKSGLAYRAQSEDSRIVYIPPLTAVWERAREKPCAFINFKWLPAPHSKLLDGIQTLLEMQGWASSETFARTCQTSQSMKSIWDKQDKQSAEQAGEGSCWSLGQCRDVGKVGAGELGSFQHELTSMSLQCTYQISRQASLL